MAENNMDINIRAKADKTEVMELSDALTTLKEMNTNVEVDVNIDDSKIEEVEHELKEITPQIDVEAHISDNGDLVYWKDEIETINGRKVQIECNVDGNEIDNAKQRIIDIDGTVINVDSNVDIEEVLFAKKTIQEIQDDLVTVKLDVDADKLTLVEKNIEDLKDENINIIANVDDTDINNLKDKITDFDNENIDINVDSSDIDDTQSSVEALDDSMNDASTSADNLSSSVSDIDSSSIDDVSSSSGDASENLSNASESANNVQASISNIDPSVLEQIALLAGASADEMDKLSNSTDNASASMGMVDAMASATLSAGVTAGFMSASNAAGNYSDTMVRLGYAMSSTSMTAEQAEKTYGNLISSMAEETGRGAGAVRSHLINMGNVGITSEQVLSDSFQGISKAAFQMGTSMDSMEQKFQTMALTGRAGSRQLKAFGLETKDLAKAMGVSVDEVKDKFAEMDSTSRASVLSTALNMKYGSEVTENYKNSYEHLMESMNRAKDYFIRVVGEALLPVLIPTIETAANIVNFLAKAFRGLPSPIKGVIGSAIGLVAGITAVGLGISATTKFISAAIAPFRLLMQSQRAAAIAQWLLNIAMDANPIVIVTLAIIALIAILGYLYFNNEQVRNAINGLGQTFVEVGQIIYTAIMGVVDTVIGYLEGLYTYIMTFGGLLESNISITGNNIIDGVIAVMMFIATLPLQLTVIFTNMIAKTLGFGENFVQRIKNAGLNAVSNFINQIARLPSELRNEFNKMISDAINFAGSIGSILWNAGVNAVKNFLGGLGRNSPGIMQTEFLAEIKETGSRVPIVAKQLLSNVNKLGRNIVDEFGNPSLSYEIKGNDIQFGNNDNESTNKMQGDFNLVLNIDSVDSEKRINEIVEIIRKELFWDNVTAGRSV